MALNVGKICLGGVMHSRTSMFCLVFLIVAIGCQPRTEIETEPISSPSPTSMQRLIESDMPPVPPPDRVEIPTIILIQPTPRHRVEYETGTPWDKARMPIFLDVIQTTIVGDNSVQSPTIGVGPAIYFYDPDRKILMLNPKVKIESATELLVGIINVLQTPDQAYEKREISQYPSAQPVLIQVVAYDMTTGTLTILFGDEKLDLAPGESRTFKQLGANSNTPSTITTISNYGHLIEIQPVLFDGSLR